MRLDAKIRFKNVLEHEKYGVRPFTRHSLVLVTGGLAYIVYGCVLLTWHPEGPRESAISLGLQLLSVRSWSGLWIFTGTLAILSSRWPKLNAKWGYGALTGLASGWSAVYLGGLLFENNTAAETTGAVVWGLVAFVWWAVAGLANPAEVTYVFGDQEVSDGDGN